MRRALWILNIAVLLSSVLGCAMWDGLVEFEHRKNEWLFGPSSAQLDSPAATYHAARPTEQR